MEIVHDVSDELIEFIKKAGTVANDGVGTNYYNLPQWFKYVDGWIIECDVSELPETMNSRLFTLDEMKACALAMVNWGEGFEGALTPNEYFKKVLGIDISK